MTKTPQPTLNKRKGAAYESLVAKYLEVERIRLAGTEDRGDFHYELPTGLVVVEAKTEKRYDLGTWATEAEKEAGHVGAPFWVVVAKRRGRPMPGDSWIITSLDQWLEQTGSVS